MNHDFEVQRSAVPFLATKLLRGMIRAACEHYPEMFAGFEAWMTKVHPLWKVVGK